MILVNVLDSGEGGGGTPQRGLCGEAPPKRVGNSLVE